MIIDILLFVVIIDLLFVLAAMRFHKPVHDGPEQIIIDTEKIDPSNYAVECAIEQYEYQFKREPTLPEGWDQ